MVRHDKGYVVGRHELFWKPARDAVASSENPFLQLTILVMEINCWLSPWNCGSALAVYVHYILSSQQAWTAVCCLPLCSSLPCIWTTVLLQHFSRSSNYISLFPGKKLAHIHMWASEPTKTRKKGLMIKTETSLFSSLPIPNLGRKPNGPIYSSSSKNPMHRALLKTA